MIYRHEIQLQLCSNLKGNFICFLKHFILYNFIFVVPSHQVTSTPKPGFKPLASVTPFVPQQQHKQNTTDQQQSKEPSSTYTRDKYQAEGTK